MESIQNPMPKNETDRLRALTVGDLVDTPRRDTLKAAWYLTAAFLDRTEEVIRTQRIVDEYNGYERA